MKTCINCKTTKELESFYKKQGGRENTCKACRYKRDTENKKAAVANHFGVAMTGVFKDFLILRTHLR